MYVAKQKRCGYSAADLLFIFPFAKSRFSHYVAHIFLDTYISI